MSNFYYEGAKICIIILLNGEESAYELGAMDRLL